MTNFSLKTWVAISILSFCIAVGIYVFNFYNMGLSSKPEDWGSFGSYLGGTLGPLFALFAFLAAITSYIDARKQKSLEALLSSIQMYEKRFNNINKLVVTCDSPWIWGQGLDVAEDIKELPLRTLLSSDSIDWEYHLKYLRDSLDFRIQPSGELFQDRDIWLKAKIASEGLFEYLSLYENKGGEAAIINFYKSAYEFSFNRIQNTDYETIA